MRLSNLFLMLFFISISVQASESKEANSHNDESSKSLFSEIEGKSLLQPRFLSKTHFENDFLDDPGLKTLINLSNSDKQNFSEYRVKSVNGSKYRDLQHRSDYLGLKDFSPDPLSQYLAHEVHGNEHFSFYNREMKEHGWDVHDTWENHHICTPVPEPETYAMVLLGLLMIILVKRRKA